MNLKNFILPIILFLIGMAFTIIGALFKIQHWSYGSEAFTIGNLLQVISIILVIYKLIKYYYLKK